MNVNPVVLFFLQSALVGLLKAAPASNPDPLHNDPRSTYTIRSPIRPECDYTQLDCAWPASPNYDYHSSRCVCGVVKGLSRHPIEEVVQPIRLNVRQQSASNSTITDLPVSTATPPTSFTECQGFTCPLGGEPAFSSTFYACACPKPPCAPTPCPPGFVVGYVNQECSCMVPCADQMCTNGAMPSLNQSTYTCLCPAVNAIQVSSTRNSSSDQPITMSSGPVSSSVVQDSASPSVTMSSGPGSSAVTQDSAGSTVTISSGPVPSAVAPESGNPSIITFSSSGSPSSVSGSSTSMNSSKVSTATSYSSRDLSTAILSSTTSSTLSSPPSSTESAPFLPPAPVIKDSIPALIQWALGLVPESKASLFAAVPFFSEGVISYLVQLSGSADAFTLNASTTIAAGAIERAGDQQLNLVLIPKNMMNVTGSMTTQETALIIALHFFTPQYILYFVQLNNGTVVHLLGDKVVHHIDRIDLNSGPPELMLLTSPDTDGLYWRRDAEVQVGKKLEVRSIEPISPYTAAVTEEACGKMKCFNSGGEPARFNPFTSSCYCLTSDKHVTIPMSKRDVPIEEPTKQGPGGKILPYSRLSSLGKFRRGLLELVSSFTSTI